MSDSSDSGPILNTAGEKLGTHTGLMDYTIGQRKGLGISYSQPLYVVNKEIRSNTLIVGTKDDLGLLEFRAINTHWISGVKPSSAFEADVKIRYKAAPKRAMIRPISDESVHVILNEPANDVTPGQGLVIYDGEKVLGSGSIRTEVPGQH
jgi:tRNA-specific 2-thiouridylase